MDDTQKRRLYQLIQMKRNRLVVITPPHPLVHQLAVGLDARWDTVTVNKKQRDAWVFHRDQRATIEQRLIELFDQPLVALTIVFKANDPIYDAPSIDGFALYDLHHQILQRASFQSPVVRDLVIVDEDLQPAGVATYPALRGRIVVEVRCRRAADVRWQDAKHQAKIEITDVPSST